MNTVLVIGALTFLASGCLGAFGPNAAVTSASGSQQVPDIAVGTDGTIYVAWYDEREGSNIYFAKSLDHGQTFVGDIRVNDSPGHAVTYNPSSPKIVERDGMLTVVWPDNRTGYSTTNIRMAQSIDGGATWGDSKAVGTDFKFNIYPDLHADASGNLHLLYYSYSRTTLEFEAIKYRKSVDAGATWTSAVTVNASSEGIPCDCCPADIADFPNGTLFTAFRNNVSDIRDMYGVFWAAGNTNWGPSSRISYQNYYITFCPASGPDLATVGHNISVTYMVGVSDIPRVFVKTSVDYQTTLADSVPVDPTAPANVMQDHPASVMTTDSVVHILWGDSRNYWDVYYGTIPVGGTAVTGVVRVNDDGGGYTQRFPRMVADAEGNLFAVWQDGRGGGDIYFATTYVSAAVAGESDAVPSHFRLEANVPNPFNPSTVIRFELPESGMVDLKVYDLTGREVRSLVHETLEAGYRQAVWDGRDEAGRVAPAGIYIYRLEAGSFIQSRKMVLVK